MILGENWNFTETNLNEEKFIHSKTKNQTYKIILKYQNCQKEIHSPY